MSKHAPTFVLVAVISGTLIFCGASGVAGVLAQAVFLISLVLSLICLLSDNYKRPSPRTNPPFVPPR
jgi:uncharacterized membrane protein YtjA (UPF0391 family)